MTINNVDKKWSTLSIESLTKTSGVSSCFLHITGYSDIDEGGTSTQIDKVSTVFSDVKTWDITEYASIRIMVHASNGTTGSTGCGARANGITFT